MHTTAYTTNKRASIILAAFGAVGLAFAPLQIVAQTSKPDSTSQNSMSRTDQNRSDSIRTTNDASQFSNLVEAARQNGEFSTFLKAVDKAGMTEQLRNDGPYTIFAPTDAAFEKLGSEKLESVMNDERALRSLIDRHIVDGVIADRAFRNEYPEFSETTYRFLGQEDKWNSMSERRSEWEKKRSETAEHMNRDNDKSRIDGTSVNQKKESASQDASTAEHSKSDAPDSRYARNITPDGQLARDANPPLVAEGVDLDFEDYITLFMPAPDRDMNEVEDKDENATNVAERANRRGERDGRRGGLMSRDNSRMRLSQNDQGRFMVGDSTIAAETIRASNGIIHPVDTVLTGRSTDRMKRDVNRDMNNAASDRENKPTSRPNR